MAVTNGTVKVVIDIKGQGDGSKVVDEAARSVKRLEDSSARASSSTAGLGDSLKNTIKPANGLKEGLGQIIGSVGFFGSALVGAIDILGTIGEALFGTRNRTDEYTKAAINAGNSTYDLAGRMVQAANAAHSLSGSLGGAYTNLLSIKERNARAAGDLELADQLGQKATIAGINEQIEAQTTRDAAIAKSVETMERQKREAIEKTASVQDRINKNSSSIATGFLLNEQAMLKAASDHTDIELKKAQTALRLSKETTAALRESRENARSGLGGKIELSPFESARGGGSGGSLGDSSGKDGFRDDMAGLQDRARQYLADTSQRIKDDQAANDDRLKRREARDRKAFKASNDNKADAAGLAEFNGDKRAQSVRDFSAALIDGAPVLDQYSASLGKLTDTWAQYAKTGENMAGAVTASLSAIGKAGAQHIKDERARAGVLAIIETGLGFATLFTNPAESAGHFVAAGVLGFAAATGIGAGGGKSAGGSGGGTQQRQRTTLLQSGNGGQSSGPIVNNFSNNNFFGPNKQETAAALYDVLKRQRSAA